MTITKKHKLPDNRFIYHTNTHETEFLYDEIFIKKSYLNKLIKINKNSMVFDIGANIGLFSIFIKDLAPDATIICFEPSKESFKTLLLNMKGYSKDVSCFNIGLSNKNGKKKFTYYPGYSVISGFYTNRELDENLIMTGEMSHKKKARVEIEPLIKERFNQSKIYKTEIKTLETFIKENKVRKIDLLKIDAEKAEYEILLGLHKSDWLIVKQIIVEIHGKDTLLKACALLKKENFEIVIEKDSFLEDANVYTVFGKKL